ncbi:MAG TPA: arylsulfotransferase family protein, partial [Solirubrobacteraceae bacterium]|nr:arylsulfotransferase family protein [Solirubrobacteraceae bacterium]
SALVGRAGHTARVSSTFTVARPSGFRPKSGKGTYRTAAGLVQSFVTAPSLHPPALFVTTDSPQASPGDVFFTPTAGYGQAGMMIVNEKGSLVWFRPAPAGDDVADLQVESYKGHPALVWWQGHVPPELGVGLGEDEIYNSSYEHVATVRAGNGAQADLHDIQLTPQGSAFITAYSLVDANLSAYGGASNGTLQDAMLQEIDVPTGLVMFEWHAYGHVALGDSYSPAPTDGRPWDYFHINSVSFDPWGDGNFIVSSRNTWAAYEIDHQTGAVLWRLGGRHPSFHMGAGTGFAWQHDVRWQADDTLTIFDDGSTPKEHSQSRAVRERIDWQNRSVSLVGRDVHSPPLLTGSQGNDEVLGDGDSFVGWGELPYMTEYGPSGQILFDAHFPAPGESYRAFRFPWSATPGGGDPPAVAAKASSASAAEVFASWNGATGIASWTVLGGASPTTLAPVASAADSGFETAIPVSGADAYFAVQAVGAQGQVLGTSAAVKR